MIKRILALILSLGLMNVSAAAQQAPMGRYVEREISMPEGVVRPMRLQVDGQGALCLYGVSREGIARWTLGADQKWTYEVPGWARQIANPDEVGSLAECEGAVYMLRLYMRDGKYESGVLRGVGDTLDTLTIESMNEDMNYVQDMYPAPGGTLIASGYTPSSINGTFGYDAATGARRAEFEGADGAICVVGDRLLAISVQNQSVMEYDLETGAQLREMPDAPLTEVDELFADEEAVYLLNAGGIYRIARGGSVWECLVDGNLTSLRMPTMYVRDLAVAGDTFYALAGTEAGAKILSYAFDGTVSTLPSKTLRVYTLRENRMLGQAASIFQLNNPDYLVDITVLLAEDAGATADDVLRALGTELLAGSGPDVLLLDGMPTRAYIEKGVLADLSGAINPLIEGGELLGNLFTPFVQDGALYQVPTEMLLPVVMGSREAIERAGDWDGLVRAAAQGLALSERTMEGYCQMFRPASFPAWFDESGALSEDVFQKFLEDVQSIYAAYGKAEDGGEGQDDAIQFGMMGGQPDDAMRGNGGNTMEVLGLPRGEPGLYVTMLQSVTRNMIELNQVRDMDGAMALLSGQAGAVFAPRGMLGANAHSPQVDAATRFIQTALSAEVQDVDLFTSFPVRSSAMERLIEREETSVMMTVAAGDPEISMMMEKLSHNPDRTARASVGELARKAQKAYLPDATLLALIDDALAPFYRGEQGAAEATKAVSAKVRAYLAE